MPKIEFFRQLPISTLFDNIPQNNGDFRKNTAYNSIKYRIMYYESTNKYVIFRPKRIAPEFFSFSAPQVGATAVPHCTPFKACWLVEPHRQAVRVVGLCLQGCA